MNDEERRFKHFGRPSIYTDELADEICEKLAKGIPLTEICKDEGMPGTTTVYVWLGKNEAFRDKYARAREVQADVLAAEILQIADDGKNDKIVDGDGNVHVDYDHIQRSRLRVDARKWYASKLAPKKYGERVMQEVTGKDGAPLQTVVILPANGRETDQTAVGATD